MKFGLSFLPDASPETKSGSAYFKEALALCDRAEKIGFDYVKMTEHYLHPYGGYCPSPLNFLSAIAARTERIRLMTGCILPAFHHPIQIASETAMLDNLSNGRLDVGFARAYLPHEFAAFGVNLDDSRQRFTTTIEAVQRLWSEEKVTIDTEFFRFQESRILPRVIQQPHPPIWCAAVNSRQSFYWIGEKQYNLLVTPPPGPIENIAENIAVYFEGVEESGGDPDKVQVALSLPVLLDNSQQVAEQLAKKYLSRYLEIWSDATRHWLGKSSSDYPGYEHLMKVIKNNSANKMLAERQAIVGTPETVIEQIEFIQKAFRVDVLLLQIDFGAQPVEVSLQTLDLFSSSIAEILCVTS